MTPTSSASDPAPDTQAVKRLVDRQKLGQTYTTKKVVFRRVDMQRVSERFGSQLDWCANYGAFYKYASCG